MNSKLLTAHNRGLSVLVPCCVLLVLAFLLLSSPCAYGTDYEAHLKKLFAPPTEAEKKERIQGIKKDLENKSLSAFKRKVLKRSLCHTRAVGFAVVGWYGELIGVDMSGPQREHHLFILPDSKGGLEFVYNQDLLDLNHRYARLSPEGEFIYSRDKNADERWRIGRPARLAPMKGGEQLKAMKRGEILSSFSEKTVWDASPPVNCIGWYCRLAKGGLWGCDQKAPPPENCIWAVRRADQGLNLIHAGPLDKGLFAAISPDRIIEKMPDGIEKEEGKTYYWHCKTTEEIPAFVELYPLDFNITKPPTATLNENGTISITVDPIE